MTTSSGICEIKSEYVVTDQKKKLNFDFVSEKDKKELEIQQPQFDDEQPEAKKQKLSKRERKRLTGQNKSRGPTFRIERSHELCNYLINISEGQETPKCEKPDCKFLHDINKYLELKPKDIGSAVNIQRLMERILLTMKKIQTLRKKTYNFDLAEALVKYNDKKKKEPTAEKNDSSDGTKNQVISGTVTDEDIIALKKREKKRIDWTNKLFLSPLTTVGNLPFRRICKEFGADITCGEMAMCSALLQGAPQEWALVKRHKTKSGQLLTKECDIDFIDLNLGCPIELVYIQGGGCGLLRRPKVLESCVKNLSDILPIPLTVKMRTGVYNNENLAHILAPKMRDCGASLITIHGRSREQRYTKSANWEYIRTVAEAAAPIPVFGNGDILSYEDYVKARETAPQLNGVMIGRGALIKPWIFTEIKEKKLWDISSSERFDILKKYTNYGLEHWGSDNRGVENTRKFLLEWLSFLYRYVPVGLLECPPQKINERPPFYKGRDDLETLMASPSASDWIKISEMLLGPVPDNFHFLPKHKANSYN
ncbi:hypothetical protein JTB14_009091 [Gonioctena quinquepunctata]|nr:hypothetical protein JTB14_009091 [Gonioctena quinquepunctata]